MTLKDFKQGQKAYIVSVKRGQKGGYAIKECEVVSVGRKYVTVFDLDHSFNKKVFCSGNSITDECLYEKDNWETIDRLFFTKEAANNCIEKDELLAWLIYTLNRNNNNNKYTLEQLRAVKAILEEEKQCMK